MRNCLSDRMQFALILIRLLQLRPVTGLFEPNELFAARSFENGDLVERQPGVGSEKWERSANLRR